MEEIIVGNEEQLYENVKGQDVYIYGAKTVAMRTCKSIEMREGGMCLAMWYPTDMIIHDSYMASQFIG